MTKDLTQPSAPPANDLAEAIRQAQADPKSLTAQTNLGIAYGKVGRFGEAAAQFVAILARHPTDVAARRYLGIAHQELGNRAAAADCFEAVVAADPSDWPVRGALASQLLALGRPADALAHLHALVQAQPQSAGYLGDLGFAQHALGRSAEAASVLRKAVSLQPAEAGLWFNLGCAELAIRQFADAVRAFDQARLLKPDWSEAHRNLGAALQEMGRLEQAVESHRESVRLDPKSAEARNSLGTALQALNRPEQAIAAYEEAIALDASYAEPHHNLGNLMAESGRIEQAQVYFERAISLQPNRASFHRSLASVSRFREGDPRLAALERMAPEAASLAPTERVEFHFALGKAYEDLGRHEEAFQHWLAGGALKRTQVDYDERAILEEFKRLETVLTAAFLARKAGLGDLAQEPVMIVGMPRSGTSLVEQILASHPSVHGAGELQEFEAAALRIAPGSIVPGFSASVAESLGAGELRKIGSAYAAALRALGPGSARITDKLPDNFRHVGLIRLALPRARIIHVMRDPVDTCLSCFSQLFAGRNLPYTYDLAELGRHYRAYQALMRHWRSALGPSGMLEVRYESVVDDLETEARRIVEYCGLPWNDACLAFHETRRSVKTASMVAVRRPIYRSAIGRSAAVRKFLGPLLAELE